MKNRSNRYWFASVFALLSLKTMAQDTLVYPRRCASDERNEVLNLRYPGLAQRRTNAELRINKFIKEGKGKLRTSADGEIIRIPVVVHVVHNTGDGRIGGLDNPNISKEQILSQIEVLNEDYRRKEDTNGFNTDPVGVDTGIEFFLAEFDEDGRVTDGITRTYTQKKEFDPRNDDDELAALIHWPSDQYLNIWVCKLIPTILGVAQFPSVSGLDGMDMSEAALDKTDGVFIDFKAFGRQTGAITSSMYNLGRTATHEIGHWLGLIHPWGLDNYNCGTDYCEDTPPTDRGYEPRTAVCEEVFSNCNRTRNRVMIENYMDYSPDKCMNIFTADQLARMKAVLALSPRRVKLIENEKKGRLAASEQLTISIYPNPITENELRADVSFFDYQDLTVTIYDLIGLPKSIMSFREAWSKRIRMDVSKLPAGIYILEAKTNNEVVTKRFVVY
jgi:hypothetical protein